MDQHPAVSATLNLGLDLDAFEDVLSADVALKDPTSGAPTGAVITVAGPEHPTRRKIDLDRQRRVRAQLQKTGKLTLQDPEDDEADQTDALVACTLGWRGLKLGGQPLEFSREAAQRLYTDPKRRWLRAQVIAAMDERESFIARSAAN